MNEQIQEKEIAGENLGSKNLGELIIREPGLASALLDMIRSPIVILDPLGEVVMYNRAYWHLLNPGPSSQEIGFIWDSLPHEDKQEMTAAVIEELSAGNTLCERRLQISTRKGCRQSIECSFAPLYDGIDTVALLVCTVQDITDKLEMQESDDQLEKQLVVNKTTLQRKEIALGEILDKIKSEKKQVAGDCQSNIDRVAKPILRRLKDRTSGENMQDLKMLEKCLDDITSPYISRIEKSYARLTPREIEICNMILEGLTSKEIASTLCTAENTVRVQRKMIRTKLKISRKKANLRSTLLGLRTDNFCNL